MSNLLLNSASVANLVSPIVKPSFRKEKVILSEKTRELRKSLSVAVKERNHFLQSSISKHDILNCRMLKMKVLTILQLLAYYEFSDGSLEFISSFVNKEAKFGYYYDKAIFSTLDWILNSRNKKRPFIAVDFIQSLKKESLFYTDWDTNEDIPFVKIDLMNHCLRHCVYEFEPIEMIQIFINAGGDERHGNDILIYLSEIKGMHFVADFLLDFEKNKENFIESKKTS